MRLVILLLLVVIGAFWVGNYPPVDIVIKWGNIGSASLSNTAFIGLILFGFTIVYLLIDILHFFISLRKRLHQYKHKKLIAQANTDLTNGLVHFTEGHWKQSEKSLTNNVNYSETPLLNYLVAARAAHMQEAHDRRDSYLKKASEEGDDAQTAVSVSQAEMQFSSGQLEQSRATLIHLLEVSPKHPYAIKLLAKIYFQQQDWDNLFSLLPELNKQSLIKESDRTRYETTTLKGIFKSLALKNDRKKIQVLWKKLPLDIREKPDAILLYCDALSKVGNSKTSDKLLLTSIEKSWDEKLIERYGLIEHENLGMAIKRAEKWLENNQTSPNLLLALARLNKKYQLWGKSKVYYNSSLNFSPSATVYLELAELLEELGEVENAQVCYKLGLKYSIKKKGEILNLKQGRATDPTIAILPDIDEEAFSS